VLVRRSFSLLCLVGFVVSASLIPAKTPSPRAGRTVLHFPPPLVPAGTVSAEELLTSAQKLLPAGAFLGPLLDANYAVIDHDWMTKTFMPFYREAVSTLKSVASDDPNGADCDEYGLFLRQMTGLAGMVARSTAPAAAQVVVFQGKEFSGVGRTRERHAVGLFLTDRGWFVMEPQNAAKLVPISSYVNRRGIQYITFH